MKKSIKISGKKIIAVLAVLTMTVMSLPFAPLTAKAATAVTASDLNQLETYLQSSTSYDITLTQSVLLTYDAILKTDQTLHIAEGQYLYIKASIIIIPGTTLTLTGPGSVSASSNTNTALIVKGTLNMTGGTMNFANYNQNSTAISIIGTMNMTGGTINLNNYYSGDGISIGAYGTMNVNTGIINIQNSSYYGIDNWGRLNIESGATVNIQNTDATGICTNNSMTVSGSLNIANTGGIGFDVYNSFTGSGGKISLAEGAVLKGVVYGKFIDRGALFSLGNGTYTVVGRYTFPVSTALSAGDYTWDGTRFSKPLIDITTKTTDANFKSKVYTLMGRSAPQPIYDYEAASLKTLNVYNSGIKSLAGIEYFPSLETLNCSGNQLTALDVSILPALKELNCAGNLLTSLDVSGLTALTLLDCRNNLIAKVSRVTGRNANLVEDTGFFYIPQNTTIRSLTVDGAQTGTVISSKGGPVSFPYTAMNFPAGIEIKLNNLSPVTGIVLAPSVTTDLFSTVTVYVFPSVPAGSYSFSLTASGVTSGTFAITVSEPTVILDTTKPACGVLKPNLNTEINPAGILDIGFNENMSTAMGTITFNNTAISGGTWIDPKTFRISYLLNWDSTYTLDISGFKDTSGNLVIPYSKYFHTQSSTATAYDSAAETINLQVGETRKFGSPTASFIQSVNAKSGTPSVATISPDRFMSSSFITITGVSLGTSSMYIEYLPSMIRKYITVNVVGPPTRTVKFYSGATLVDTKTVTDGTALGANWTSYPAPSGFNNRWYTADYGGGEQYTFSTVIKNDINLYQKTILAPPDSMLGDVNLDGEITITDLILFKKHMVGQSLSADAQLVADMDKNGAIDSLDLVSLRKKLLGIPV